MLHLRSMCCWKKRGKTFTSGRSSWTNVAIARLQRVPPSEWNIPIDMQHIGIMMEATQTVSNFQMPNSVQETIEKGHSVRQALEELRQNHPCAITRILCIAVITTHHPRWIKAFRRFKQHHIWQASTIIKHHENAAHCCASCGCRSTRRALPKLQALHKKVGAWVQPVGQ